MNKSIRNAVFWTLMMLLSLLNGCGTTKKFTVDSNPKGALLLIKPKVGYPLVNGQGIYRETPIGETPLTAPVTFLEDTAQVELIAEKRGYAPAAREINKDSAEAVHFDLKKIDGVPEAVFSKASLSDGTFTLFPVYTEVHIHSGVGRLDKIEHSADMSEKITDAMNDEFVRALTGSTTIEPASSVSAEEKKEWRQFAVDLNKYLRTLDPKRLAYYSEPPYISKNIPAFDGFVARLKTKKEKENPFVLYILTKCITETAGRKAGNVALALLGAASQGASRAAYGFSPYYDYSAFQPDSGTLAAIFVIDAKTSEVVHIDQRVFDDITDAEDLKSMVGVLTKFPLLDAK